MTLDPPLGRWERRALWLWCLTSGAAAAGMAWGVFWWWIIFFVTIPFVFAAYYAPTVWLYLTPALLIWLALRRRPLAAMLTAGATLAIIAVGVPVVMNRQRAAQVRSAAASDRGSPVAIGTTGGSIAWLGGTDEYCSADCLRFLITGRAQAVLVGPALQGPPDPDRRYLRIRLIPWSDDRGCPLPPFVKELVHVPHLSLIDPNQCVSFDRVPLGSARLIFNQQQSPRKTDDASPAADIKLQRQLVYGWLAGRPQPLMQRTDVSVPEVAVPLTLWPYNGADTSVPAQWGSTGAEHRAGIILGYDAMTMVAERLHVPEFDAQL